MLFIHGLAFGGCLPEVLPEETNLSLESIADDWCGCTLLACLLARPLRPPLATVLSPPRAPLALVTLEADEGGGTLLACLLARLLRPPLATVLFKV